MSKVVQSNRRHMKIKGEGEGSGLNSPHWEGSIVLSGL